MRRGHLALVLACCALPAGACGSGIPAAAPGYTCGEMRADAEKVRLQARAMVKAEGLQERTPTVEATRLDVEVAIRTACQGARGDLRPYRTALGALRAREPAAYSH